ncbi:MAG: hypothetical protein ACTSPA_09115 [Promethearchaeota archaeon]
MSFANVVNHMDWSDRTGMMDWNFNSMGPMNIFGVISIFALIMVFLILSRRIFYSDNGENTSHGSKSLEIPTPIIKYEEKIEKNIFYCIHCGIKLNNPEIKYCPECGAYISP